MYDLCLFPFGVQVFKKQKEQKGLPIFNYILSEVRVNQDCRNGAHFFLFENVDHFPESIGRWRHRRSRPTQPIKPVQTRAQVPVISDDHGEGWTCSMSGNKIIPCDTSSKHECMPSQEAVVLGQVRTLLERHQDLNKKKTERKEKQNKTMKYQCQLQAHKKVQSECREGRDPLRARQSGETPQRKQVSLDETGFKHWEMCAVSEMKVPKGRSWARLTRVSQELGNDWCQLLSRFSWKVNKQHREAGLVWDLNSYFIF